MDKTEGKKYKKNFKKTPGGTPQQNLFKKGKILIRYYEKKKYTTGLTKEDENKEDKVKIQLWQSVKKFAMQRARQRMTNYMRDSDAYKEVEHMLIAIFFEKLDKYDPDISAPTTFFVRYFDQVISEYLHEYSQHMTSYDAQNIAKVREAKHYFEANNIKWDIPMIATRSRLSIKVTKQALQRADNSIQADVDSMINLKSNTPEPDEVLFEKERSHDIMKAITDTLTEDEQELFFLKVNVDGKKSRAYREVVEILNKKRDADDQMTERAAKQKWSAIIAKLNNCRILQQYNRQYRGESEEARNINHSIHANVTLYNGVDALDDIDSFFAQK